MSRRLEIRFRIEPDAPWCKATGRNAWALTELHRAGARGVTPINNPGPRWSAYVHNLRRMGLAIETIHESHTGRFPGSHARYVLLSGVSILDTKGFAT